jgi:ADP-ribosylglycohydrolase
MERPMELAERLAGAVWGHLVGDAVGVPYEFRSASEIHSVEFGAKGTIHRQPPGTWSDDGALMLALLDSLLRDRRDGEEQFDVADQGRRALAWADDKAYTPDADGKFDIGGATGQALDRIRHGVDPAVAGGTSDGDNGNGSLMRILPVALVEREVTDEVLVEHAHRASAVTHGHRIAQAACALYVLVARQLLEGRGRAHALETARVRLHASYAGDSVRLEALELIEGWSGRSGRGYVVDSFWSAWDAFAGASDYRSTIEAAVRYGRDTDTTACIAGGLAGIRWGIDGIPAAWLDGMRGHEIVSPLVDRLLATAGVRTSTAHPLRVDWVDLAQVPRFAGPTGRLGMTFLPGKRDHGIGGAHWRDVRADAARLRSEWATDTLVLLVDDEELRAANVRAIDSALAAHDIELVRLPIADQGVPTDRAAFAAVLDRVIGDLSVGRTVVVACRGGLGRTGTLVGYVLRECGLDGRAAIELTRASRHGTIENARQEAFVEGWQPRHAERDRQGVTPGGEIRGTN